MAERQEDIMGQYQQWLHYREIERRLRMQVETLEAELAELQARARSLEENDSCADDATGDTGDTGNNELLRLLSLAMRLDAHASSGERKPASTNGAASSSPAFINEATGAGKPVESREPAEPGAGESFSPTLFPWGGLPDFGPQEMPFAAEQPIFEWASPSSPPSSLPQSGIELLPEDMGAFFDEHSQTDSRLELPWWQQEIASANIHSSSPIDQQGLRYKHEIERWLERWRRQPAQPENQGDTRHE
jgi:hypothetical protein